jgi:hypothetical protein
MNDSFKNSIDKYIRFCKNENWIEEEAYKFEYANYVNCNVDWDSNSDSEILQVLQQSQKIKYTTDVRGIQFIQKSGRVDLKDFISLKDIKLFREFRSKDFEQIDWIERTMSFTALSAWLASLFPEKFYPIPMKGIDQTVKFLFNYEKKKFPKVGHEYLLECQSFMEETWNNLGKYPIEDLCLTEWNKFYNDNPELNIPIKTELSLIDKVWLVQDFHLFVHRQILNLYKPKNKTIQVAEEGEPTAIEGNSVLAQHMRYERNNSFVQRIKKQALAENKMLNCQICGFSFFEKYGEIGEGFIEAHHKNPLSERNGKTKTKREDIALVCSNCHRMLHRGDPTFGIEEIKQKINRNDL